MSSIPLWSRFESGVLGPLSTRPGPEAVRPAWWFYPLIVLLAGGVYGATMGSWDLSTAERWRMIPYAGLKVPLLVLATTAVCLPGYFVLSSVLGLRADFRAALAAIAAGQAATALSLASLAPLTRFVYVSGIGHQGALMFSAAMFTLAAGAGYAITIRRYRPLLARSRRHRLMLAAWITMYVFVGIQMGWMLRPFVGTPGMAVTFFRQEPFSNAYVAVAKIALGSVKEATRGRTPQTPPRDATDPPAHPYR